MALATIGHGPTMLVASASVVNEVVIGSPFWIPTMVPSRTGFGCP